MVRPELVDKMVSGISLSVRSGEHEPARAGVTMISFLQAHGTFNERNDRSSNWESWEEPPDSTAHGMITTVHQMSTGKYLWQKYRSM